METLGSILREAREAKGLSIKDVADATRIMQTQLRGLEADDFTSIPAPVYAKSFIKTYASHLGVDHAPLLQRYAVQSSQQSAASQDAAPKAPRRKPRKLFQRSKAPAEQADAATRQDGDTAVSDDPRSDPSVPPKAAGPSLLARLRGGLRKIKLPKLRIPDWARKKPDFSLSFLDKINVPFLSKWTPGPFLRQLFIGFIAVCLLIFLIWGLVALFGKGPAEVVDDGSISPESLIDNPVIRDPDLPYLQPRGSR